MQQAAAPPKIGFRFLLRITKGPHQGATFQMIPPIVTIGRDAENHIVLTDPKVSRHAVRIEITVESILIFNLSKTSVLYVNGQKTKGSSLKGGDTIQIGETEFSFLIDALPMQIQPSGSNALTHSPQGSNEPIPAPKISGTSNSGSAKRSSYAQSSSNGAQSNSGKFRFYIVIGVLGLGLAWLLQSKPGAQKKEQGLKTVEELEAEMKESEDRQKEIVEKRQFSNEAEHTRYLEAQGHYLVGFRDYQKGQFLRAIKSFETALAIDPKHILARRYIRLSEKKRDELIASLVIEGRKYKEKSMYSRCVAAFDKALDAIPNKNDLRYRQAETQKRECELLDGEKFR